VWSLHSGVLDNTGRWVAHTDRFSRWVTAEVNLQRTVFHWDFQGPRVKDIVARYGPRIAVETFGPEALFTLTPVDPDLDIAEVIRAFELVPYRDYVARATAAQDAARENAGPSSVESSSAGSPAVYCPGGVGAHGRGKT